MKILQYCRERAVEQRSWLRVVFGIVLASGLAPGLARAQDFEQEPINYETAPTDTAIDRLQSRLDDGRVVLPRDTTLGQLKSLLKELDIPISSQTLVFSKTSLQRNRIAPHTPRAIYFNDDVYIGYCHQGEVFEASAIDPSLGPIFYSLSLDSPKHEKTVFTRQTYQCLSCHASPNTHYVPGLFVRSVYVGRNGFPLLSLGTHRIDHTTPIDKRWGGWYVTGTHGKHEHLGNLVVADSQLREPIDNAAGQNVTSLEDRFVTSDYLSPHSDLVALMVLEHQAEAHNLMTQANYSTRKALDLERKLNKELHEPDDHRWDSTNTRIRNASESLVRYLLFSNEAPLDHLIQGTSQFATEFTQRGPRDSQGRSLRDFDLTHRLFRYPCSYLIYSRSFDALPDEARKRVFHRLWEVLTGVDQSKEFAHLSPGDRTAIFEILRETKPNLPDYWTAGAAAAEDPQ